MIDNPISFFSPHLIENKKLCLLPMTRMHSEKPVWLSEKMVFYPRNSLSSSQLHVVWEPKREAKTFLAGYNPQIEFGGIELNWMQSAMTGVSVDELLQGGLLAFPLDMDWESFLTPMSHEEHLNLILRAIAHAEKSINQLRFDYCRIDVPETLPERAGLLENKLFSAALFYTPDDHESYIVSGDVVRQSFTTGLGLQIDGLTVRMFSSGEVGNIASHALQMHSDALEAPNDTAKFVNLINLLDYLAAPSDYIPMAKAKGKIARHVAKSPSEYNKILDDFKFLTSVKDKHGNNIGLRHNIIHLGRRLEDIIDKSERKKVLIRMNRYAGMVIEDLLKLSDSTWKQVEELREVYGQNLGLNT